MEILRHQYGAAVLLSEYLNVAEADGEEPCALLLSSIVVSNECGYARIQDAGVCVAPNDSGGVSQAEVVNNAIRVLVARNSATNSVRHNVLALGFRVLGDGGCGVVGIHGVEVTWPNSIVTLVKSPTWTALLDRIGVSAMTHLLLHTSMFCALPNGCYFQMTGIALSDLPRHLFDFTTKWLNSFNDAHYVVTGSKRAAVDRETVQSKKVKLAVAPTSVNTSPSRKGKPAPAASKPFTNNEIVIPRYKIFYKRPIHSSSGKIMHGLPRNHLLNRFGEEEFMPYIFQTVFPRQFKLPSVFTTTRFMPPPIITQQQMKYNMEISKKARTPWRLGAAAELIKRFLTLHRKCKYIEILQRHCPRKFKHEVPGSEHRGLNILTLSVPHDSICRFVKAIVRRVIPHGFWGSVNNEDVIIAGIDQFIRLQRFESFTLEYMLKGFKISACEWLVPPHYIANPPKHVPPNDMLKRKEILNEFLYWILAEFVIPVINSNFYVTESTSHKNKIFYFRHEDWSALTSATWKLLGTTTFKPVKAPIQPLLHTRTLGFSYIRLLPKETGFRPIMNLRRRQIPRGASKRDVLYAQSINSMLQNAFRVLQCEARSVLSESATVAGMGDVYPRLKVYQSRVRDMRPQKLYFVKADIVQCFDTIDQNMLMEILKEVITEEEYLVRKYSVTYASVGKIKRSFEKFAKSSSEFQQFAVLAHQLAGGLRNAVITDGVIQSFEDREALLKLLEEHICRNLVKMGRKFYQQVLGIPQGSVLSSLLCSFFLSHMERKKLRHLVSKNDLLLRLVDDFLFVTPDMNKAVEFVRLLHKGILDYGCSVNPTKTVVNFDMIDSGMKLKRVEELSELKDPDEFPWCGLLIHMKKLQVKVDYTRLAGSRVDDLMSVEFSRKPWVSLQLKLFHYIIPKCHPLFLDLQLNSEQIVLLNIYQNFFMCGMKLYTHMRSILQKLSLSIPNAEYLFGIIRKTIRYTQRLVQSHMRRKMVLVSKGIPGHTLGACKFSGLIVKVEWLGLRAFAHVLRRKQANFAHLLEILNEAQNSRRFDGVRLQLQGVSQHRYSKTLDAILF